MAVPESLENKAARDSLWHLFEFTMVAEGTAARSLGTTVLLDKLLVVLLFNYGLDAFFFILPCSVLSASVVVLS